MRTADPIEETRKAFSALHAMLPASTRLWLQAIADENAYRSDAEILADGKMVFAVWADEAESGGLGVLLVKGFEFLGTSPSNKFLTAHITAIKCDSLVEACRLARMDELMAAARARAN